MEKQKLQKNEKGRNVKPSKTSSNQKKINWTGVLFLLVIGILIGVFNIDLVKLITGSARTNEDAKIAGFFTILSVLLILSSIIVLIVSYNSKNGKKS